MPLLLFILLSVLCVLRIPAAIKVRESRASWLASAFGLVALYVLGTVTPLEVIDSYLGGINLTNLLQSVFALLAFFFFNDCVRDFAAIRKVNWTYYIPLLAIPIMVFFFVLIQDKGPTAANFIVPRMDQPATAAYSGLYMLALLFTDLRIIYMLRSKAKGIYTTFLAGLLVVALACLCHITYVLLFHFSPWSAAALVIGSWFDRLFYVGLSVTALGWIILFLSKRLPQARFWLNDAIYLTVSRLRLQADQSKLQPIWDLFNDTLESGAYKSVIVLRNYERANLTNLPTPVEDRLQLVERKLNNGRK